MKGFVTTPPAVVDLLVGKLFECGLPSRECRVLDPGCGRGAFIEGIIRWCDRKGASIPRIVGIELDAAHVTFAREHFAQQPSVEIRRADFLSEDAETYDFIIGNPPYVALTGLTEAERVRYRGRYFSATNRFDLYVLFFEEALRRLTVGGRLVFITPEKYLYVESAAALRRLMAQRHVAELHFVDENIFGDLVTYPLVTTLQNTRRQPTTVSLRDGTIAHVMLSGSGESWQPALSAHQPSALSATLSDACTRISCGIATGADQDFLLSSANMSADLAPFAYPTIAGRQLIPRQPVHATDYLLIPYLRNGTLLQESDLGPLRRHLSEPDRKRRLQARTCAKTKPWYAYHETPLLEQILRPKILCKDIGSEPYFFLDESGSLVPRHSVYYLVPKDESMIRPLLDYLNSEEPRRWLMQHCQRAAKGFVRLQSHVLKRLPIPPQFLTTRGIGVQAEGIEYASA
jgi:adenine-specific DNA-methyltransferase